MTQKDVGNAGQVYPREILLMEDKDISVAAVGNWWTRTLGSGGDSYYSFRVPADFESLKGVKLCMIPDATETIQWDCYVSVASPGEDYNVDDRQDLNRTLAVTTPDITEANLNQGNIFDGIVIGDWVAIRVNSNTNSFRIIKVVVEYYAKY